MPTKVDRHLSQVEDEVDYRASLHKQRFRGVFNSGYVSRKVL